MAKVSVIIVNYNGAHLLADCLGSLKRQTHRDFEVILVDNGSTDESVEVATLECPELRLLVLEWNTGFAQGNNLGIRASGGEYVVLLNNDAVAAPDFLRLLLSRIEQDETIGMVAPKILNFYDRTVIDSVGGLLLSPDGIGQGRGRGERDSTQHDGLVEVLLPSACAALYRRSMLDEIGLFPEDFVSYCEDTDLGLRARWAGWGAVSAPDAVVYHKYSATAGEYSPEKLYLVERNHFLVALRNFPAKSLATLPFWSLYRYVLMFWAVLTGRGKGRAARVTPAPQLLGAFLRGHWSALRHAGAALGARPRLRRIPPSQFRELLRRHRFPLGRMMRLE
jgi:GT2 family glycosyltransferase